MTDTTPQEGTTIPAAGTPATTAQAPTTTTTPEPEVFDREYVSKLRSEAASYRTKLKQLEDAQAAAEQAKMGDLERATKALETLKAQTAATEAALKMERVGRAVEKAAMRLGLDPELASKLLDPETLEFVDGVPSDPEKQLKALLAKWPQLAKPAPQAPSINASDGRGPAATPDPKAKDEELKSRFRIK